MKTWQVDAARPPVRRHGETLHGIGGVRNKKILCRAGRRRRTNGSLPPLRCHSNLAALWACASLRSDERSCWSFLSGPTYFALWNSPFRCFWIQPRTLKHAWMSVVWMDRGCVQRGDLFFGCTKFDPLSCHQLVHCLVSEIHKNDRTRTANNVNSN
jgi:hypothetical protein